MYDFLQYRVEDAMTPSPLTVTPATTLRELEQLFETHDFNGVPVLDEDRRLLGMATKFDILKAFALNPQALVPDYDAIMEQSVDSVMTREPVAVDPELPMSRLLQKMVEMRTKSFPVVRDGRLVGVIAREDVLKALRRATSHGGRR
ncbi:MAG: CBS domain-containing protein [Candidatus Competibacteraceae bacterium]|nr:CBS domain-containing protein [Candidatus Competibacteraceae bacterium]